MIHKEQIEELRKMVAKGDYTAAATIYEARTTRKIDRRHLQKFVQGQFIPNGRRNAHNPIHMFSAVSEAVRMRLEKQKYANTRAAQMLGELKQYTEGGRQGTRKRARTLAHL